MDYPNNTTDSMKNKHLTYSEMLIYQEAEERVHIFGMGSNGSKIH